MKIFHLLASIELGLIARPAVSLYCYTRETVYRSECARALSQIIYQSDGSLDQNSTSVEKAFGGCSITVSNVQKVKVTKKQIGSTVSKIIEKCNPHVANLPGFAGGGNSSEVPDVSVTVSKAGTGPYRPGFPFKRVVCSLNAGGRMIDTVDCLTAYNSFHVDPIDFIMSEDWKLATSFTKSYKSCTVGISTTDGSMLIVRKKTIYELVKNMVQQCPKQSGVVNVKGGTTSLNGHTVVTMSSSML